MFVANKGTEDEWSCRCCDPNGFHHHDDDTCEHVRCDGWEGQVTNDVPHDSETCDYAVVVAFRTIRLGPERAGE